MSIAIRFKGWAPALPLIGWPGVVAATADAEPEPATRLHYRLSGGAAVSGAV
jgi:hypothetical protein